MSDPATRPWRLRGYAASDKNKILAQKTCRGDHDLDRSMKRLEADQRIDRITVEQTW